MRLVEALVALYRFNHRVTANGVLLATVTWTIVKKEDTTLNDGAERLESRCSVLATGRLGWEGQLKARSEDV
jgi:hypothetical protein